MSRRNRQGRCRPNQSLYQPTYLAQGMSKMSISDTIPEGEGETMSSGMADFLGGNGSTPKREVSNRAARIRRTNASPSITTTPRSGSTKPSLSHITAESRSDERTPSRSKSATGSARTTTSSSSNTKGSKSFLSNSYQQELVDPHIALNGFNLPDEKYDAIEDDLEGRFLDESRPRRLPKILPKMDVLVACPKTLQQSSVGYTTTTFLFALAKGIPIVTPEWIDDSIDENKFLPPTNYLLMGHSAAEVIDVTDTNGSCDPHYSLALAIRNGIEAASNGGILTGYCFTMCHGIGDEDDPFGENPIRKERSSEEVRMLLTAAGAIEVDVEDMDGPLDKLLVIMSMKATKEQIQYATNLTQYGGYRVSLTVILQTLTKQSLDPLEKLLEIRRKEEEKTASTATFFTLPTDVDAEVEFDQSILDVTRSLSRQDGDTNRAKLGELGTLKVVRESGVRTVYYFDQANLLKFMSTAPSWTRVPSLHDEDFVLFGNGGLSNFLVWEATNVAGKSSSTCDQEVLSRRFFFKFRDRPQLDTFLMALFGNNDPSRSILQEWYDKNGRFYRHEETLPAHDMRMAAEEDEMYDDDFVKEARILPRTADICKHDKDTYAESQAISR